MIPPLDPITGYLPPGQHDATWDEVVAAYGYNPPRQAILAGLALALTDLASAGCNRVYLDGSFVTAKPIPGDFDLCFDPIGVDPARLNPLIRVTGPLRHALQRSRYRGDIFPSNATVDTVGTTFVDFLQRDLMGRPKGLLILATRGRP